LPSPHFLTIGHSNHEFAAFCALLRRHQVTAIADVRSAPYSRRHPHFNKERLHADLQREEIAYVFLGAQLGARTKDRGCYANGRVQYDRLAATAEFQRGIDRLFVGARSYCVALMCAEREPLDCHRTVLIARALEQRGASVAHIHADGSLEAHGEALLRLIDLLCMAREDLLDSQEQLIAAALDRQAERIAWRGAPL
jgi:uncharacterized protein (DUF488 family)